MSDETKTPQPPTAPQQPPVAPQPQVVRPAKAKKIAEPTHYRIGHSAVGEWRAGEIVIAEALANVDIKRLIALGAIAPTEAPGSDDAE